MVLPAHATVPTHHLGLMSGFIGAHTTQIPPQCRYSGHPALVRGQRAGLHALPRCSGGPGAGARYILPQGRLKVWALVDSYRRPVLYTHTEDSIFPNCQESQRFWDTRLRCQTVIEKLPGAEEAKVQTSTRPHRERNTAKHPNSRPLRRWKPH